METLIGAFKRVNVPSPDIKEHLDSGRCNLGTAWARPHVRVGIFLFLFPVAEENKRARSPSRPEALSHV